MDIGGIPRAYWDRIKEMREGMQRDIPGGEETHVMTWGYDSQLGKFVAYPTLFPGFDTGHDTLEWKQLEPKEAYDIGMAGTDIATKGADIATTEVGMAATQGGIDYQRGLSQFWDTMEDKFYTELTNVEGNIKG